MSGRDGGQEVRKGPVLEIREKIKYKEELCAKILKFKTCLREID